MKYQVRYEATYYVEALDEDHAIDLAVEQHSQLPDGSWEAVRDPYESPLSSLADGTYRVDLSAPTPVIFDAGYWVAVKPVECIEDVQKDAYLGIWTDPSTDQRYYDQSELVEFLGPALELAREHNQISIWDIANNEAIPVFG
jgi:hypothetical protein